MSTDYTPGDAPVPLEAVVHYYDRHRAGQYNIVKHHDPAEHPNREISPEEAAFAYPDGVAYDLWPVGMLRKFGLRDYAVYFVRRTSFRVVSLPGVETPAEDR